MTAIAQYLKLSLEETRTSLLTLFIKNLGVGLSTITYFRTELRQILDMERKNPHQKAALFIKTNGDSTD